MNSDWQIVDNNQIIRIILIIVDKYKNTREIRILHNIEMNFT